MPECKECGKGLENNKKYSIHLCRNHDYSREEAYREVNGIKEDPLCEWCDKPHRAFTDFPLGYRKFCSRSCSASHSKHLLMNDEERANHLREKVSASVKEQWNTLDQTERIKNMKTALNKAIQAMSSEERKEKYGNKPISEKSKLALKEYWEGSDTQSTIDKRANTLRETWRTRGKEIMDKQMNTFLLNRNNPEYWLDENISDEVLKRILGI